MILIDPRTPNEKREGPRLEFDDLERCVSALGVTAVRQLLEFGDAAIWGWGPGEQPVDVVVELKKPADALQCMTDGRFSGHQLTGLARAKYRYLVIEGPWRADKDTGLVVVPRNGTWVTPGVSVPYSTFARWLISIGFTCGVRHWFTPDRKHTARFLVDLHEVVTKPYSEHTSHLTLDESDPLLATIELSKPNLMQRWAKELPGVGRIKSRDAAMNFASARDMANADESAWLRIKGIGKTIATQVVKAIREGEK